MENAQITERFAFGENWSRFARPGATRVAAEVKGDNGVKATAFSLHDGKRVACVMINTTEQPVTLYIAVARRVTLKASLFVTDESRDLAKVEPQGDDIILPPRGVSTLVLE